MGYINIFVEWANELMSFEVSQIEKQYSKKVRSLIWDTLVFDKF